MALKALMLRRRLDEKQKQLDALRQERSAMESREAELETALGEAATEEEMDAVEEMVETFSAEMKELEEKVEGLETDVAELAQQLKEEEKPLPSPPEAGTERKVDGTMSLHVRAFGSRTAEQRAALVERKEVQDFLVRVRELAGQKRAVTGAELAIPEVLLELVRENVLDYSKLVRHVRMVPVGGRARQIIMGTIPEAVWTEMCAALNELSFGLSQVEVDGYKVGGYVALCNALEEDNAIDLLGEIISGIGQAIGVALDKAIVFGTGVKMPLGIATRLAQAEAPSDYPDTARPWENLSQSNVITIPTANAAGLALFQAIATAAGAAKGKYSRGEKFWVMNEATYTLLTVQAMSMDASGAIVSAQGGTMPVIGGAVEVLSDDIIPDNTIIGGYGDLYLLAERAGTAISQSTDALFIQDKTVVKGTARYDGLPVIPEGFVAIGIGAAPRMSMSFAPDTVNPAAAALAGLAIGGLTLTPAFAPGVTSYTAATTNDSDVISAVPAQGGLAVIRANNKGVTNGGPIAWKDGPNAVSIEVTNGDKTAAYTVTVTKTAAGG